MLTRQATPDFASNATEKNHHNMVNPIIIANKNLQTLVQAIEIEKYRLSSDSSITLLNLNDQDNNAETSDHMESPFTTQ